MGRYLDKIRQHEREHETETRISGVAIEPAVRPTVEPVSPVFWESMDGRLHDPCPVSHVAKDGPPGQERYRLIVLEGERMVWVHERLLRTRP